MHKVLLLSILLATIGIPVLGARNPNPVRGLKMAVLRMFAFECFYLVAVVYLYPRL
jgi:hypothetical protein